MIKDYIKKIILDILLLVSFLVFVFISCQISWEVGKVAGKNFLNFLVEMLAFLPLMFILIGLFDVWVPRELVVKHIGHESGIKGIFWVVLLATLQAGPLYAAFPVAALLYKKGGSIKNIFIYLGAFSVLKIPMLTFEITFLGLKFSLLRTLLTLPIFIAIGYVMEWILKKTKFEVTYR